MQQHENLESLLYEFQLKSIERWTNGDTDSLETFIRKFLTKNKVDMGYQQLREDYTDTLKTMKMHGRLSDTTYIKLLEYADQF